MLRNQILILLCVVLWLGQSIAQTKSDNFNFIIGPELQIYPTGLLPGMRVEKFLSERSSINLRVAIQIIDHRDLGVHDDETGNGWGLSLGYRSFFTSIDSGWSLAGRLDYWRNSIDWTDNSPMASGNSKITVLQPTALLEYQIPIQSGMLISPSLGLGYEWNVKTEGEPTGEGAILLVGVTVGFQL